MATGRENLFDAVLVKDLMNKVKGKSSLAVLSGQTPIPFNGLKEFIFSMDNEIDIVAENGKKSEGGITVDPVKIVPIKFEYGARVSDEFLYATEEEQLDILTAFNNGFAAKVAKGFDLAAFHGINPRTGGASTVVGTNHFDSKVTQKVEYTKGTPDTNLDAAIAMVQGSDGGVKVTLEDMLLASIADHTKLLTWMQTEDARKGKNRPKTILPRLLGEEERKIISFETGEEFEKEWKRLTEKGVK